MVTLAGLKPFAEYITVADIGALSVEVAVVVAPELLVGVVVAI